jgi:putative glutamine amidotransferase
MTTSPAGRKPVIGLSAYSLQARWGSWDLPAVLLPSRYADMVASCGGIPVLLPPAADVTGVLPRLDGLVLSGGGDIDPARYGAVRDADCGPASRARDEAEIDLCHAALAAGLPLLGICRGLQVINVALGGTLHQHLPALVGHDEHSPDRAGYGIHKVSVAPGSRLASVLGVSEAAVPTHHHQSADRLGVGLTATAWTDDGVIEAVEFDAAAGDGSGGPSSGGPSSGGGQFMIAVQWHPEAGDDASLFTALVAAAGG